MLVMFQCSNAVAMPDSRKANKCPRASRQQDSNRKDIGLLLHPHKLEKLSLTISGQLTRSLVGPPSPVSLCIHRSRALNLSSGPEEISIAPPVLPLSSRTVLLKCSSSAVASFEESLTSEDASMWKRREVA
jgi:hypothetical protein